MQNIIWGFLILAFVIDIIRRMIPEKEKALNQLKDQEQNIEIEKIQPGK